MSGKPTLLKRVIVELNLVYQELRLCWFLWFFSDCIWSVSIKTVIRLMCSGLIPVMVGTFLLVCQAFWGRWRHISLWMLEPTTRAAAATSKPASPTRQAPTLMPTSPIRETGRTEWSTRRTKTVRNCNIYSMFVWEAVSYSFLAQKQFIVGVSCWFLFFQSNTPWLWNKLACGFHNASVFPLLQ